jgi:hypothetical protein
MEQPKTKRRSRTSRTPQKSVIEITPRDIQIFRWLDRYPLLRSTHLQALCKAPHRNRFSERLGQLYHGYKLQGIKQPKHFYWLERPAEQRQYANARYMPAVYALGDGALEALYFHLQTNNEPQTWVGRGKHDEQLQFAHTLMIYDILSSIEIGVRENPNLRFISWQEIIEKAPHATKQRDKPFQIPVTITYKFPNAHASTTASVNLTPDGLFGLEYKGAGHGGQSAYRFFALEADRATMPVRRNNFTQTSYLKKVLSYKKILEDRIYERHFGLPNLFVLNVTPRERHKQSIMELVREEAPTKFQLFKTMSTLGDFEKAPMPTPHMLIEPWDRVGFEPFRIDQS